MANAIGALVGGLVIAAGYGYTAPAAAGALLSAAGMLVLTGSLALQRRTEAHYRERMLMSRKLLCAVYAAIALVALVATWSQNIAFFRDGGSFLGFFEAPRSIPHRGRSPSTSRFCCSRWRS